MSLDSYRVEASAMFSASETDQCVERGDEWSLMNDRQSQFTCTSQFAEWSYQHSVQNQVGSQVRSVPVLPHQELHNKVIWSHPQYSTSVPPANSSFSHTIWTQQVLPVAEQVPLSPDTTWVSYPQFQSPVQLSIPAKHTSNYHVSSIRTQTPSITPNRITKKRKRKRRRTAFTTDQVIALEKVFAKQPYIDRNQRQVLTQLLKIDDRAIKVWFQNRRMKGKRDSQIDDESDEDDSLPQEQESITKGTALVSSSVSPVKTNITSHLDYIESQIHNADEDGFVTLDQTAWNSLFEIINYHVSQSDESDVTLERSSNESNINSSDIEIANESKELVPETTTVNSKVLLYEPVSPANAESESSVEDGDQWQIPNDQESIKRLFNLHFC